MKKIYFLILMLCFGMASGQPNLINYQGVILSNSGVPMASKSIRFKLTILDGSNPSVASGIYSESHQVTTSSSGMFQFQIGGGTVENGSFSSIPWSDNQKYVKLEVDTNGGTNYKHFATSQLVSVPFALAAGSAGSTSSIKDQNGTPYTVTTQNGTPTLVATASGSTLAGCGADILYKDQYYSTVVIGGQCWMAENLNVGSMINTGTNQSNNGSFEKYCYNNDPAKCSQFGGLYQWAEAMDYKNSATNTTAPTPVFQDPVQGICPKGWRIPTYEDISTLTSLFPTNASASLRSSNNLWSTPGTNETNFSFFPSGYTNGSSSTQILNVGGFWYSHSVNNVVSSYLLNFVSTSGLSHASPTKTYGYSVRCVKNGCANIAANAGIDIGPICGDSVQLAAQDPGNGLVGKWTVKGASASYGVATFSNSQSPISYFKGDKGVQYTLAWTVNGCSTSSDEVKVQFTSKANAGYDQLNNCDSSIQLDANKKGVGESANWSIINGSGGSFVNDTSNYTIFKGKLGTTYQLVWTNNSSTGNCITKDTVSIGFFKDISSPVNAGNDISGIIIGDSITLNGSSFDSTENGYWSHWSQENYSFWYNHTARTTKAIASSNFCSINPVKFIWQVQNTCFVRRDTLIATFISQPKTIANVNDSIYSTNRWVTLNGNSPNSREKVKWTNLNYGTIGRFIFGPSSYSFESDSISPIMYIASANCDSSYKFVYSITNKTCLDSTSLDTIKVRFNVSVNTPLLGMDKLNITSDTITITNNGLKNISKPFYSQYGSPEENYSWQWYVPSSSTNPPLNTIGYPMSLSTYNSPDSTILRRDCQANYYTILRVNNNYCTNPSSIKYDTLLTNFSAVASLTSISSGINQSIQGYNSTSLNATKLPNPFQGSWSLVSRNPSNASYQFSNYNANNTLFSGQFGATFTLRWSAFNSCSLPNPTTTDVTISFNNPILNSKCSGDSTITYENRVYRIVKIGNQCWMKDDLNVGTMEYIYEYSGYYYRPYDTIVNKYCPSNDTSNCSTGGYYNWYEAIKDDARASSYSSFNYVSQRNLGFIRGICPVGWHIPSSAEFSNLNLYLTYGNQDTVSTNLSFSGTTASQLINNGSSGLNLTNDTRYLDNRTYSYSYWNYSNEIRYWLINYDNTYYPGNAQYISLYNSTNTRINNTNKENGLRIRCIKDW